MTRRRLLLLLAAAAATAVAYAFVLGLTAFRACGISGCSGGGYGPAYGPVEAQQGLILAGVVVLPLALLVLHRRTWPVRVAAATIAVVAGSLLAMALLDLGPDGCPPGLDRATTGPDAFVPGEATCEREPAR